MLATLKRSVPETAIEPIARVVAGALAGIADSLSGDQEAASSAPLGATPTTGPPTGTDFRPIVLARKPGPLRELAIDACRIGTSKGIPASPRKGANGGDAGGVYGRFESPPTDTAGWDATLGRWPANVVLTDPVFDGGVDGVVGGGEATSGSRTGEYAMTGYSEGWGAKTTPLSGDTGTYSRFFLIPKASRSDREPKAPGELEPAQQRGDFPAMVCNVCGSRFVLNGMTTCGHDDQRREIGRARRNTHPTVKPVELMRHLVRLVMPQGGTVLDPFLGSGSTALAAEAEGFAWVGIEREAEYVAIAEQRLVHAQRGLGLAV